jgi:hypothetical protein
VTTARAVVDTSVVLSRKAHDDPDGDEEVRSAPVADDANGGPETWGPRLC